MKQTISSMLGLLPSDQFSVSVTISEKPLYRLLISSIITENRNQKGKKETKSKDRRNQNGSKLSLESELGAAKSNQEGRDVRTLMEQVLWNPFEDIVPRVLAKTSHVPVAEAKEPPKKPVKKLNLLSIGEEAEEEEKELTAIKQKIKSSHDAFNDPRLLKAESTNKERNASDSKEVLSVREAMGSKKEATQKDKSLSVSDPVGHSDDDDDDEDETKFDAKMRNQVLSRRKETGDIPPKVTQKKK